MKDELKLTPDIKFPFSGKVFIALPIGKLEYIEVGRGTIDVVIESVDTKFLRDCGIEK